MPKSFHMSVAALAIRKASFSSGGDEISKTHGVPSGLSHLPFAPLLKPFLISSFSAASGSYFHQPVPKTSRGVPGTV